MGLGGTTFKVPGLGRDFNLKLSDLVGSLTSEEKIIHDFDSVKDILDESNLSLQQVVWKRRQIL